MREREGRSDPIGSCLIRSERNVANGTAASIFDTQPVEDYPTAFGTFRSMVQFLILPLNGLYYELARRYIASVNPLAVFVVILWVVKT